MRWVSSGKKIPFYVVLLCIHVTCILFGAVPIYADDASLSDEEHMDELLIDELFPAPERFYDPSSRNQEWRTKLSTDLLQLVDSRYHPDNLNTTAALLEMESTGLVRLSETGEPQINVMVQLRDKGRFEDIYQYLSDSNRDTTMNMIAGWIHVGDLQSAALLPDVHMIEVVLPPTVSATAFMWYDGSYAVLEEQFDGEGNEEYDSSNATNTTYILTTSPSDHLPSPFMRISSWESKLSSDIMQLLDPGSRSPGQSRDELVSVLKATGVLRITSDPIKTTKTDEILVDAWVEEGIDLRSMNYFSHLSYDPVYHRVAGWIDLQNLSSFAQDTDVLSINTVLSPSVSTISFDDSFPIDSIGVSTLRNSSGYTGKGIRIGVISDGAAGFDEAVMAGTLPPITILRDQIGGSEGVAMMEIIHAIAPDAELIFHDRGQNQIEFVQAIDKLISAGARIICDDITYIEPFFEDGYIAANIRDRILTYGVLYVTSAGNMALGHYQDTFSGIESEGYMWHEFGNNTTSSLTFRVSAQAAGHVVLQWDDPYGAATTNYELFLYDENRREIGRSVNVQDGDDDPIEWVRFLNDSRAEKEYTVRIVQADGNGNATLEMIVLPLTGYLLSMTPQTSEDSIFGQQAISEVLCVTSADFENGTIVKAPYASQGPVTILYPHEELRKKPDIAAPGTVSVSGAGGFPETFIGTSAAAPQVAGIAALLLEENPKLSESDIREAIIASGSHMSENKTNGSEGNFDSFSPDLGYGLVHAKRALTSLPSFEYPSVQPTPSSETILLPPESPIHGGIILYPGWNMISVPMSMALEGLTGADLFSIDTGNRTIWSYDHAVAEWSAVQPEQKIYACDVFWVYSTLFLSLQPSSDATLSSQELGTIPLSPGWNPLGVTGPNAVTADSYLTTISDSWSQVLMFDARAQAYRQAIIKGSAGSFSDYRMLYPGEGFWVYMNKPATFSYPP